MTRTLATFVLLATFFQTTLAQEYFKKTAAEALERIFDFGLKHYESFNFDGVLGFVIADALLQDVPEQRCEKGILRRLQDKSRMFLEYALSLLRKKGDVGVFVELLAPSIWRKNITFASGDLNSMVERTEMNDSLFLLYMRGDFDESLSDRCLMELLENRECVVSLKCKQFIRGDVRPGYGATHRLLYFQISNLKGCELPQLYQKKTKTYCSYILWELLKINDLQLIGPMADLFLEQITLCGMEGYEEFLQQPFLQHVLNMQTPHGCYTSPLEVTDKSKRAYNVIQDGCLDHTTGLAASTLSIFFRFLTSTVTDPLQCI